MYFSLLIWKWIKNNLFLISGKFCPITITLVHARNLLDCSFEIDSDRTVFEKFLLYCCSARKLLEIFLLEVLFWSKMIGSKCSSNWNFCSLTTLGASNFVIFPKIKYFLNIGGAMINLVFEIEQMLWIKLIRVALEWFKKVTIILNRLLGISNQNNVLISIICILRNYSFFLQQPLSKLIWIY